MGKLNLLQHKSWHVYNEVNRERVRKDEEEARREEAKKAIPAQKADADSRLTQLRKNARLRSGAHQVGEGSTSVVPLVTQTASAAEAPHVGHINLFEDAERAFMQSQTKGGGGKNAEAEAERLGKEKTEADQYTWYLGETRDGKKETPWYATVEAKAPLPQPQQWKAGKPVDEKRRAKKEERRKAKEDPLTAVMRHTSKLGSGAVSKSRYPDSSQITVRAGASGIEKLRAERLARELTEKQKAEELLNPNAGRITRHDVDTSFFNSQFNPGFSRDRPSRGNYGRHSGRSGSRSQQ
ncbi:hypothetical protein HKX48_001783 [Thoreauomyces humboldtii]|nr:hypothetical protein HKX48_001783 [Thoreauomyces humboldtii]